MTYTDVFGGANIYPSDVSYSSLALSANTELDWPNELSSSDTPVTRIMDVTPATDTTLAITMPPATEVSPGETVLFNNIGSYTFVVKDNDGTQICSIASGTQFQIYLTSNATAAGTWESLQYGAATSSSNASALAGTGLLAEGSYLYGAIPVTELSDSTTFIANDRAKMFVWTSTSGTLTLPTANNAFNKWFIHLRNAGEGDLTVACVGTDLIDGAATKVYEPSASSIIVCSGSAFYTIGFGSSSTSGGSSSTSFEYTLVNLEGVSGNYTLGTSDLNKTVYKFYGTLLGDTNIIVPATTQEYWVDNSTSGGSLTLKVSGQTGVSINSGQRGIFYCTGVDVVDADTSTINTPLVVTDGGTGATTATAALTNLGGTTIGKAIFTAVDADAVWVLLAGDQTYTGGQF